MKNKMLPLLATAALLLPAIAPAADTPLRGTPQSTVRAEFGAPLSSQGPVGSPAITRWNYDGFSVYFENGVTLHTVTESDLSNRLQVVSGGTDTPPPVAPKDDTTPADGDTHSNSAAADEEMVFNPVSGRFTPAESQADSSASRAEAQSDAQAAPASAPPQTASEPATATAPTDEKSPQSPPAPAADGEFKFDPVSGRIIISGAANNDPSSNQPRVDTVQGEGETAEESDGDGRDKEESSGGYHIDWNARQ